MRKLLLLASHLGALGFGFALGIYTLPILMAPAAPAIDELRAHADQAPYRGEFRRDLADSDFLHWGEGIVAVDTDRIGLTGELAPGPDYRLYLSPQFVETEVDFKALKSRMIEVGPIRTFENFLIPVPEAIDVEQFNTVIVWCESFGQFITAARYR